MTPDTSGLSSVRPFASYDRASRSWRTWTAIEASDSTEWSGTWPKTGCMSDGLSYQLPGWEPPTSASGCSSPSLRTPNARDGEPRGTQSPEKRLAGGHQPSLADQVEHDLMTTPRAGDGEKGGPNQRGSSGDLMLPSAVTLLGTPTARDHKGSGQGERLEESERRGQVEAQVLSLDIGQEGASNALLPTPERVMDLLPTPMVGDAASACNSTATRHKIPPTGIHAGDTLTDAIRQPSRWGKYAAAIAHWEHVTRPAPEPTNITAGYIKARLKRLARLDKRPVGMRGSLKVRRQLAARFSEWMMGVPLGWITDVPGITRNEALKAAGNGVVPQQAAEALRFLLDMPTGRQIADVHEPDDLLELLMVGES